MKVLLYTEAMNLLGKSGVGKARSHQIRALEQVGVEWTTDPKEKVDLVHINTIFPNSHRLAKKAKKTGNPSGVPRPQYHGRLQKFLSGGQCSGAAV